MRLTRSFSHVAFLVLGLPLVWTLALLPLSWIYRISDWAAFLLRDVIHYRREVISENIRRSFPEKSEAERKLIERNFYSFFCDLFLETFKLLTFSPEQLARHIRYRSPAFMSDFLAQKRNVIFVLGHLGNWEWYGGYFGIRSAFQLYCIYHPLTHRGFDQLMYRIRRRWRTRLIRMKGASRKIRALTRKTAQGQEFAPFVVAFIADQNAHSENSYWTTFLNQETAVFWGAERNARASNLPVVYTSVTRPRRGLYEVELKLVSANPQETAEGEISEGFTRLLEEDIRRQPEIWLWTHRRWKSKRPSPQSVQSPGSV